MLGFSHCAGTMTEENGGGEYHAGENGGLIYHERQRLQLCLLHALNNLLQGEGGFTRSELDGIANNLPSMTANTRWNPLRLLFRENYNLLTGNYDANVLYAALATRDKEVIWYDSRHGVDGFNPIATYGSRFFGIIVNVPTAKYANLVKGRHWVALRVVNERWYNLDSDMSKPVVMSNGEDDLKRYLDGVFFHLGQVLIIVNRDAANSSSVIPLPE